MLTVSSLGEGYELRQEGERGYVGILEMRSRGNYSVVLDRPDPRFGREIEIARKNLNGAPTGMKVVVELTAVGSAGDAHGKIVEVLGDPGSSDVAITGIIRSYCLHEQFPEAVLAEVEKFPSDPDPDEIIEEIYSGRLDLREQHTYTIDGLDARDLDDAISVERLAEEGYRLWIHIADVSHYVIPGSELDKEAFNRGNSVYLVDRVLPMLPPRLSNGLCSLNPGKDRLCLSCRLDFNSEGHIQDGQLAKTVIRSQLRTSYEELREIFDSGEYGPDLPEWFPESLELARELSAKLSRLRKRRGALIFDFPETKIILDEEGKVTDIYGEWQDEANRIIESFMIAANEYVAAFCDDRRLPAVYRIHEEPNEDKLLQVIQFAQELGLRYRPSLDMSPKSLQKLLEKLKSEDYGTTLSEMLLRSLAKARYEVEDLGHYGLAAYQYCHFTAPIRRYSDIIVHRAVKKSLEGQKEKRRQKDLKEVARHISEMERVAISAERDADDQKIVEYYQDKLGEVYKGKISGFSQSSMYVQLPNTVEGAVFYADMGQGYIEFVEDRLMAINRDSGEHYHIGDPVEVQVAKVDLERRFLDFALLKHEDKIRGRVSRTEIKAAKHKSRNKYKAKQTKTRSYKKRSNKGYKNRKGRR
ncbi:MAG: ribonuclease R [Eubacteriales bacterium]|nr:ribonuclease R [Eubacteriales bacterium]